MAHCWRIKNHFRMSLCILKELSSGVNQISAFWRRFTAFLKKVSHISEFDNSYVEEIIVVTCLTITELNWCQLLSIIAICNDIFILRFNAFNRTNRLVFVLIRKCFFELIPPALLRGPKMHLKAYSAYNLKGAQAVLADKDCEFAAVWFHRWNIFVSCYI